MSRYSRQELFAGIGADGQKRIRGSRVALVGCGALGSVLAETMTRAGVARLAIIDRDFVEESNLQRQVLFDEADARDAVPKAVAAVRKLAAINSDVEAGPARRGSLPCRCANPARRGGPDPGRHR